MEKYKHVFRAIICGLSDVVDAVADSSDRASSSVGYLGSDVSRLADELAETNKQLRRFLDLVTETKPEPKRRRRRSKRLHARADYSIVN